MSVVRLEVRASRFTGATFALKETSQSKPDDVLRRQIFPPAAATHTFAPYFLTSLFKWK